MSSKPQMIIITAPSGSGKTTICRFLVDQIPSLAFSVSATNREPRAHEVDGVDYHFYSLDDFQALAASGKLVEWEEVYKGQFYGTPYSELERAREKGLILIFDIDVKGALNLKNKLGDQALSIFIKPPSLEELRSRLIKRDTENKKSLERRLKRAEFELDQQDKFDVIIVNDDLRLAQLKTMNAIKSFIGGKNLSYEEE